MYLNGAEIGKLNKYNLYNNIYVLKIKENDIQTT